MTGKPFVIGERFGRLVLTDTSRDEHGKLGFRCDCGTDKRVHYTSLRKGAAQSCGCLRRIKVRAPRLYPDKTCEVCGATWTPRSHAQASRNSTCGPVCRGGLIALRKGRTDEQAAATILANTTMLDSGCLQWMGRINKDGYARVSVCGRARMAHRICYEARRGPIAAGLQLDHLCRNRGCLNPDHLEAVTQQENVRRGERATKTHCAHGHPFDEQNTYWHGNSRACRTCRRARRRAGK